MAASIEGALPKPLADIIQSAKVFVVGAGGIGCEVLKNLVLSGFVDIEIIDLDTIDLSNLNRQFLFHREHVGQSKAKVAVQSVLQFNPDAKVKCYHDTITSTAYGVNFFQRFDIVLNALDNRAARNHVNRMCLNAGVPLIESGTAGYNGQVELIKKGLTQCYECQPKAKEKTFPGCTIRNTPSEMIHCIVWAKHLFNQLFGETIDDEDISPDFADPEAGGDNAKVDGSTGNLVRVNTRQWAKTSNYDANALFNKFFFEDINYLLEMSDLWQKRRAPTPIKHDSILIQDGEQTDDAFKKQYHKIWSLKECAIVFNDCIDKLRAAMHELKDGDSLVWDKDNQPAMDFVAASANIRAYIFNITRKSRFEIKSMAGNIIPAIATTNAITAGIVVMHAMKVLLEKFERCQSVYMRLRPNPRGLLIVADKNLTPPNPKCIVCSAEPAIRLRIDTEQVLISELRDKVLVKELNMINPDVTSELMGTVIISSEEGETECNDKKPLSEMGIVDGVILKVDDFFQNYKLSIIVEHASFPHDQQPYEVIANAEQLGPKEADQNGKNDVEKDDTAADGPTTSKRRAIVNNVEDDDNDCFVLDEDIEEQAEAAVDDKEHDVVHATNKLTVESPDKESSMPQVAADAAIKTIEISSDEDDNGRDDNRDDDDDDDDDDNDDDDDDDTGPTPSKRVRI